MNVNIHNCGMNVNVDDQMAFAYHGTVREGRVEKVTERNVTIQHADGKFKAYRFADMQSLPQLVKQS